MPHELPELLAYIAKLEAEVEALSVERRELATLLLPFHNCDPNCGDCLEAQQYLEDHHLEKTDA